jgi:hypothetical protein
MNIGHDTLSALTLRRILAACGIEPSTVEEERRHVARLSRPHDGPPQLRGIEVTFLEPELIELS